MGAADIGGLLIAAALLAKADVLKDILPVTPTTPPADNNDKPICGEGETLQKNPYGDWICVPRL